MKTIIIDDYVASCHYSMICDKKMMTKVHTTWNIPDKIIVDMNSSKLFSNKSSWSDLSLDSLKFLICANFIHLDHMTTDHRCDLTIPSVDSFLFLVSCLIYWLESSSQCQVEIIRIRRIRIDYLNFDFTAASSLMLKNITSKPELKIIVDNTR